MYLQRSPWQVHRTDKVKIASSRQLAISLYRQYFTLIWQPTRRLWKINSNRYISWLAISIVYVSILYVTVHTCCMCINLTHTQGTLLECSALHYHYNTSSVTHVKNQWLFLWGQHEEVLLSTTLISHNKHNRYNTINYNGTLKR